MRIRKLAAALCVAAPTLLTIPASASAQTVREITFPAIGDVHFTDTYGAPRSGGRTHEGVDILGEKMTPLVAAVDGTVSWMRHDAANNLSGNMLTITDADGWKYHYIHINNDTPGTDDGANRYDEAFGPGIEEGATVQAGQLVAYLGDSGNAEWTAPHLHFEIETPDGVAINPYPSVKAAEDTAANVVLPPTGLGAIDAGPFGNGNDFVEAVFERLWAREPTAAELAEMEELLSDEELADAVETVATDSVPAAKLNRLYESFFLRPPDDGGMAYWLGRLSDGVTLQWAAEYFARGDEFQSRYAGKDFDDFMDQLYSDVLEREPDEKGKAYWLGRLESGAVNRGTIVVYFSESEELRNATAAQTEATVVHLLIHGEVPDEAEIAQWETARAADVPTSWLITDQLIHAVTADTDTDTDDD